MNARMLTYPEWSRRRHRRERLIRYGGAVAGVVLPALLAWIVVGLALGCGGASGEIAKGMLIRDAVGFLVSLGLIVCFVVVGLIVLFVQDVIDSRRRRKERTK